MTGSNHPGEDDNSRATASSSVAASVPVSTVDVLTGPPQVPSSSVISKESSQMDSRIVVNSEMISSRANRPSDPLTVNRSQDRLKMRHFQKLLASSTRFEHVSMDQIERIRNMHEKFSEGAEFSFNYNTLLLVASILAGLGLASNSSTTIIASMLVSPIMGPVVGMAYGATIQDWKLFKVAFKTEMLSLIICILMGFVIGLSTGWTELGQEWPTVEMYSRCTWQNFMVALPIAFFSGLGVAVSLLDDQTSSLVGVAISASLLPPAVNCGMMWTAYGYFRTNLLGRLVVNFDHDQVNTFAEALEISKRDFRRAGGISLFLTVANVLLIIAASMIMFRLKERLPIKKKVFWEDLGVARKIYSGLALMEDTEDNEGNANPNNDEVQSTKNKNLSPETAAKISSPAKSLSLIEEEELRIIKSESADGIVAAVTSYDSA